MLTSFLQGLGLMLGLIAAIGAQNAFLLRQGLKKEHVFLIASLCFVSDVLLVVAGVYGMGVVAARYPAAMGALTLIGAGFLVCYGAMAFRNAWRGQRMEVKEGPGVTRSRRYVIGMTLAFTYLNPQVYLDCFMILGGVAAEMTGRERLGFILGCNLGSAIWFYGVGYGARLLLPLFRNPRAWQALDVLIGLMMWGIAAALVI